MSYYSTVLRRILVAALMLWLASCAATDQPKSYDFPWENEELALDDRIDLLLSEMTTDEKISQLWYDSPAIPRLNIEAYNWWNEALHGVARSAKATVFPQTIGLAATFDSELMHRIGDAISDEGRAIYNQLNTSGKPLRQYMGLTYWSPNVNIFRDPRWGRGQETYGEDPYLSGSMGAAFVKGMQGPDPDQLKVATCSKHFAVHSGPEGERHGFNALVSAKEMAEFYLPAFKMCVDAGVEAVMCAYNRTNNEPCCGSPTLLQDILRDQWDFNGHIVSDCGAIMDFQWGHHYTDSLTESIALALKSGVNLNCGQAYRKMADALTQGLIDEKLIDTRLRPLLKSRFKLGFFDQKKPYDELLPQVVNDKSKRELAREAAQKSIVLLQNKNNILPLSKDLEFLYMVGPLGGNILSLVGNYNGLSPNFTTIVKGVTQKVTATTRVEYRPGVLLNSPNKNPIDWYSVQSREADATICVVGFSSQLEGEEGEAAASATHGDNPTMQLPESQLDLIRRLANDQKPVILVVCAGSPVDLSEVADLVDAIVYAWYPGEAGGLAVADILFGDVSPSGKLPITFPESVNQLPAFNDYTLVGRTYRYMDTAPLFPFGYGLGYASFALSDISIIEGKQTRLKTLLTNHGEMEAEEVLQLYITLNDAPVKVPRFELKDFKRIRLRPGETRDVEFILSKDNFYYFDDLGKRRQFNGTADVYISNYAPMEGIDLPGTIFQRIRIDLD